MTDSATKKAISCHKVTIVDYGMGNIASVRNAFHYLGVDTEVVNTPPGVMTARLVVLPGVGAFGDAMRNLHSLRLIEPLNRKVMEERIPFLGICLGMQLLADESDEKGTHEGLGWIPGRVEALDVTPLRVPHMGWNDVIANSEDDLMRGLQQNPSFYFVHSYQLRCKNRDDIHSTVNYGGEVTAAVRRNNLFAVQFHPERSHHNGLGLLTNFLNSIP